MTHRRRGRVVGRRLLRVLSLLDHAVLDLVTTAIVMRLERRLSPHGRPARSEPVASAGHGLASSSSQVT